MMLLRRSSVGLVGWSVLFLFNLLEPPAFSAPAASSALPSNLFTAGQTCAFTGLVQGATWSVADWQQKAITHGTLASGTTLSVPALPIGYYLLTVLQGGKSYTVPFAVVINPASRVADPQSPYAVDSAQAWQAGSVAGQDLNAAAELASLAGVPQVRDRFSWKDTNAVKGTYNWGRYAASVQTLAARHIDILDVYSGAPAWSHATGDLPTDMTGLYDFNQAAARQFAGSVSAWEFWNEPDLDSCSNPAWDFATCQKIAYLGLKAGAPAMKVLVGSNAITPTTKFFEVVLQNSVGAGFDIFNVHLYGSDNVLPGAISEKNQVLARYGLAGKPIWATEVGAGKDAVGNAPALVGTNKEMDATQEIAQAEQVVKSLVTLHAQNVQRSFYFLLLPYNENNGTVPWGLLRWDWTVKPGFCALANLTSILAGHNYAGKLNVAGVNAWVLEKRGQVAANRKQTVVFWASGAPVSVTAAWAKGSQLTDLMGTPRALTLNSAGLPVLAVGAAPQFLTNVTPQLNAGAAPPAAPAVPLQPVVFQFAPADVSLISNRTSFNPGTAAAPASLKVWNLSTTSRAVTLANASSGVTIGTLPGSVTVPARQQVTVPLTLTRTASAVTSPLVKITGSSGGMAVAPLVVPIRPGASAFKATPASIWNTGFWRSNSGGTLAMLGDKTTNSIHFNAQFSATASATWWVFPALVLKSAGLALHNTAGVVFDTKADGTSVKIQRSYAIVKMSNGSAYQIPIWIGTSWFTNTILWEYDAPEEFDPSAAIELQIGANSGQAQLGYSVRNLGILTAP